MQNASSQATGEAMPAAKPADNDPALAAVRALPVNAAGLVHDAINAMLARTAPRFPAGR